MTLQDKAEIFPSGTRSNGCSLMQEYGIKAVSTSVGQLESVLS